MTKRQHLPLKTLLSLTSWKWELRRTKNIWVVLLPFKSPRSRLPCHRIQTERRYSLLGLVLDRKQEKLRHFLSFMERILRTTSLKKKNVGTCRSSVCTTLKKTGKIRIAFDSDPKHNGVSVSDTLTSGSYLNNIIIGVLIRFLQNIS